VTKTVKTIYSRLLTLISYISIKTISLVDTVMYAMHVASLVNAQTPDLASGVKTLLRRRRAD
jgi:hypothetical protein